MKMFSKLEDLYLLLYLLEVKCPSYFDVIFLCVCRVCQVVQDESGHIRVDNMLPGEAGSFREHYLYVKLATQCERHVN